MALPLPSPDQKSVPAQKSAQTQNSSSPGRILISDPEGDVVLFPCAAVPERFRVATEAEIYDWHQRTAEMLEGLGHSREIDGTEIDGREEDRKLSTRKTPQRKIRPEAGISKAGISRPSLSGVMS